MFAGMSDWCLSDEAGRALVGLAAGSTTDPEQLTSPEVPRLAHRHGLTVLAARALSGTPKGQYLAAVAARMWARQSQIDRHVHRILTDLSTGGVKAAVVKGSAIRAVYRDPTVRTYTDADIVVPRQHLQRALEVLGDYEHTGTIPAKVPAGDKRDIVVRDPTGMQFTVDLHWDLFGFHQLRGRANHAMEEAWDRARYEKEHRSGPQWILPPEAVAGFLSLHSVLDHRFRLILFRDLLELERAGLDWPAVADFAQRHGFASLQLVSWLIAERALGVSVPTWFIEQTRRGGMVGRIVERQLAKTDLVRFDGHRVHLLNLAFTQLHDDRRERRRLLMKAPLAFPGWRRRVHPRGSEPSTVLDVLVTSDVRRGAEVFGRALTDSLIGRGWEATLVSLHGSEGGGVSTVPLTELRQIGGLKPAVVFALRKRIRRIRPSIVLANGGATLRYAVAATALMRRRPTLVYGAIGEPSFWIRSRFHRVLQRWLTHRCDHVVAVSAATAKGLEKELGLAAGRVTVVHPGIGDEWFNVNGVDDDAGRPMRILFAGSLSYEKAPLTAVHAARMLGALVELRLAGEGSLREELEQASDVNTTLLGQVEDMAGLLAWADVLVLPSLTEGLPGVALEASASGVPVVASDVGGVSEVVTDGVNGYLVTPGDAAELASILKHLADDPELRAKMGKAARQRAWSDFRLRDSAERYARVFRSLIAR